MFSYQSTLILLILVELSILYSLYSPIEKSPHITAGLITYSSSATASPVAPGTFSSTSDSPFLIFSRTTKISAGVGRG